MSPLTFLNALLLLPSWIYQVGSWIHRQAYQIGILPQKSLPVPVLCVGNITAGGTGKSTTTLLLARSLNLKGKKVGILTRGYKGGDEAVWMKYKLNGIPILVNPDRFEAGQTAIQQYGCDLLIMDDGFQHWKLQRDADILCVDALDPFGGGYFLPAGRLREKPENLNRAHLIIITHADQASNQQLSELEKTLQRLAPHCPRVVSRHRPMKVRDLKTGEKKPLETLKDQAIVALSSIGNPASFEKSLESLGAKILKHFVFPDHHAYTLKEISEIRDQLSTIRSETPLITTEKDAVRFPLGWEHILSLPLFALEVELEILDNVKAWEDLLNPFTT